jgi:Collagen triple helix repeat (20 copies)
MSRSLSKTILAFLFVIAAAQVTAQGNDPRQPVINSATISADHTTLFVEGAHLLGTRSVILGGVALSGVQVDSTGAHLIAKMSNLPPGSYKLVIDDGRGRDDDAEFIVMLSPPLVSLAGPTGPVGPMGPVGPVGPVGPGGTTGSAGAAGAQGPAGPVGSAGPAGPVGPVGPGGATGPAGSAGAQGPAGQVGSAGPVGPAGAVGPVGTAGAQGPAGPVGPAGTNGAMGPAGAVGAQGPAGSAGAMGPAGPVGPTGAAGTDGAVGPAGPIGPIGLSGPSGPTGSAGLTGPQGAPGAAGATGSTGPTGPMPTYFAGWIFGTSPVPSIRFGTGFSVTRIGPVGTYRITIPATPTGRFLAPVVSPAAANVTARVAAYNKSGTDLSHTIDIEIRDLTGTLVDSDFIFHAIDRS